MNEPPPSASPPEPTAPTAAHDLPGLPDLPDLPDLPGLADALLDEQAHRSVHAVGSSRAILLERGAVPHGSAVAPLPQSNRARQWADDRRDDPDPPIWIGWPLVNGHRRVGGSDVAVQAALLVARGELRGDETGTRADQGEGPTLAVTGPATINDAALDLLDVPADEQHLLHGELDALLADGAPLDEIVAILDRRGLAPGARRTHLAPVDHAMAVSATALAWVSRIDDVPDLAARQRDLVALAAGPSATDSPPLWTRVAAASITDAASLPRVGVDLPVIEPQPVLTTISRAQEQVVAASRQHDLAVALGPPGSGKSHAVVNVALAAVTTGERALVIAPDRHLAAALHEQLRSVHPGAFPLLALGTRSRAPLARAIDRALHHPVDGFDDPELAEAAWSRAAGRIRPVYARRAARVGNERALTAALAEQQALALELQGLLRDQGDSGGSGEDSEAPAIDPSTIDHAQLTARLPGARDAVRAWATAAGRGPRDRFDRRTARKQARRSVEPLLATVHGEIHDRWQQAIEHDDLARVVDGAEVLDRYLTTVATVGALRIELAGRPDDEVLTAEIDASYAARLGPSVSLSRARWATCLQPRGAGRVAARRFHLALTDTRGTAAEARADTANLRIEAEMLDAFPLWVATPEGASAFLPLVADLFDLVIIDDADDIDLGRGLPLLARARRAVLVGEPHHLGLGEGASATELNGSRVLDAALAASAADGHEPLALDAPYRPPAPLAAYIAEHLRPPDEDVTSSSSPRATSPSPALAWLDHVGGFARGPDGRSGRNAGEAIAVVELVAELLAAHRGPPPRRAESDTIELRDIATDAVAVVAPLSAHQAVLRDVLRERFGGRVTVAGFDELAGLERDIIVFSPGVGPEAPDDLLAYTTDPAGMAATLRRARVRAVVVGDRTWFADGPTALAPLARTAPTVQPAALAHRPTG